MTPRESKGSLAEKECVPCQGGTPPLKGQELADLHNQVEGWELVEEHHLTRTWKVEDFTAALDFVNRIGDLAENENHHPTITFTYGKVTVNIHTHKIDGLTESDFILAAKINELPTN